MQTRREGVWREHSYAAAAGAAATGAGAGGAEAGRDVRVLLAPPAPDWDEPLDVGAPADELCVAPRSALPCDDVDTDDEDAAADADAADAPAQEDWEGRVAALAPSAAHARLAAAAADVLRALRLARLAAPAGRARRAEQARRAARRCVGPYGPLFHKKFNSAEAERPPRRIVANFQRGLFHDYVSICAEECRKRYPILLTSSGRNTGSVRVTRLLDCNVIFITRS